MTVSDLLFPIIMLPRELTNLYVNVWLISGPLGQAWSASFQMSQVLCHLEPGPYSTGSIWGCTISSPFPIHQFKAVPCLHSRHVDHRDGRFLTIFILSQTCWIRWWKAVLWNTVEWSLWRFLIQKGLFSTSMCCMFLHPHRLVGHTLFHHRY